MICAVVGAGITGARVVRELSVSPEVSRVAVVSKRPARVKELETALGSVVGAHRPGEPVDVVILAGPVGDHGRLAREWLEAGASVVSLSPDPTDVTALLALDAVARAAGRFVACGAGLAPGLSTLLVQWAARRFDRVDEVHVAVSGNGGRACAEWERSSVRGEVDEWRDGAWQRVPSGGGELVWFPDPVGAQLADVASSADPALIVRRWPDLKRVVVRSARSSRSLSDRLLPGRRATTNDDVGAVRVEVRGVVGSATDTVVVGVLDRPSAAAAATSVVVALAGVAEHCVGAGSPVELIDGAAALVELHRRGVKAAVLDPTG